MNSFKLFGFKRKLKVFSSVEGSFKLHSSATEGEKDRIERSGKALRAFTSEMPDGAIVAENSNFLAN